MVKDMETWRADESDVIYRLLVYRRMFTPYEEQVAFSDESCYEDDNYKIGLIRDTIDLGYGDWMIGFEEIVDGELCNIVSYYLLSEIRLEKFDADQDLLSENKNNE